MTPSCMTALGAACIGCAALALLSLAIGAGNADQAAVALVIASAGAAVAWSEARTDDY